LPVLGITKTRHQEYKHNSAIYSSRAYLTSIAQELDKIYPVPGKTCGKKRHVTIKDIINEAYNVDPLPKEEYRNEYKCTLNNFYSDNEWDVIEMLDNQVNPQLHVPLDTDADGESKHLIVPQNMNQFKNYFKRIAKKTNVVRDESKLDVKDEASISGDSQ
jgi:hypothetical protein